MSEETRKYLHEHNSQETAKVVEDYPWGFTLRTTVRYWIETKKAKNGGQRFVKQTMNPKTGKWCAPKCSTYSPIMVMFLNKDGHVKYEDCQHNYGEQIINKFKESHLEHLTTSQKETLREILAYTEVMKKVTWTVQASPVGPVNLFSKDPEEIEKMRAAAAFAKESDERQAASMRQISRAIGQEMNKIAL
jgi:hypothetical protein